MSRVPFFLQALSIFAGPSVPWHDEAMPPREVIQLRTCNTCGIEFMGKANRRYCDACRESQGRHVPAGTPVLRTCDECGDTFHGSAQRRFCDTCRNERKRAGSIMSGSDRTTQLTCIRCAVNFEGDRLRRFCDACAQVTQHERGRRYDQKRREPGYAPRRIGDLSQCIYCSTEFPLKNISQQLCSNECRRAHRAAWLKARSIASRTARACPECGTVFTPMTNVKRYCSKQCSDAKRHRDPVKKAKHWNQRLQRLYGITAEQAEEMEDLQEGRCLICGRRFSRDGNKRERLQTAPRIDHDHVTGEVRGLLCYHCNVMLGQMEDRPEALQRMIEYLTMPLSEDPVERVTQFLREYPLD